MNQDGRRPAPPLPQDTAAYYGLGTQVRPINGRSGLGANWWHGGSLPGTITYSVQNGDGIISTFNMVMSDGHGIRVANGIAAMGDGTLELRLTQAEVRKYNVVPMEKAG